MKREEALRRQLSSIEMLGEAVNAMKSLSAHHLRKARAGLACARAYRDGIEDLMAAADIVQLPKAAERPALLLIGADLGLCDGYNTRLAETALGEFLRIQAPPLYSIGRRPMMILRRAGVSLTRTYPAVTSVAGLTGLLLTLADDVLGDYLSGLFSSLHVIAARFDGIGAFTPTVTRVLPVAPVRRVRSPATVRYVSGPHLMRIVIREYLYSTLYELLLDALASEHGMRLVATQSAGQWLDERVRHLRRELSSARQESSTQEVLEVATGARHRRNRVR